jgi:hypothetical protein
MKKVKFFFECIGMIVVWLVVLVAKSESEKKFKEHEGITTSDPL